MKPMFKSLLLAAGLAAALAVSAAPQKETHAGHVNLLGERIGVVGYDPVSYFPEGGGRPQKGLITISTEHSGVVYRFRTKENQAAFQANPEKYLPAYGGWCAWAVAELGKRVDVDPESFEIRDGRLLLFYRDPQLDTRAQWRKNPEQLAKKAEANWPGLAK